MTAQTFQNKTQTKTRPGSGSRRRGLPSGGGTRQSSPSRRKKSDQKSENSNKGARVIWTMMIVGGVIGAIFIFAQRSQINTLGLKRTEESLKSEIDTLASQQRYLNFQKEKALSTQEAGKVAGEFGLVQPGVGRTVVQRIEPEAKPVSETKVAAKPAAVKTTKATRVGAKQPVPVKQSGKPAKNSKVVTTVKGSKAVKPVQANKTTKDSKQMAKNLPAKGQASGKAARR